MNTTLKTKRREQGMAGAEAQAGKPMMGRKHLFRSAIRRGMRVRVTDTTVPAELRAMIGTVKVVHKGIVGVVFDSPRWPASRYDWIVSESDCLMVPKSGKAQAGKPMLRGKGGREA